MKCAYDLIGRYIVGINKKKHYMYFNNRRKKENRIPSKFNLQLFKYKVYIKRNQETIFF